LSHLLLDWVLKLVVPGAVDAVKSLLSHCETLQVCVIRHDQTLDGVTYPTLDELELIEDDRLVFILRDADPALDWRSFVKGKPDTWVHANAVVAMQRQNRRVKARSVYADELGRSALISVSVIPCTSDQLNVSSIIFRLMLIV
jgi:hypothetical protein